MNLEALSDFLAARGLLLRSASFLISGYSQSGPVSATAEVQSFTCEPAPAKDSPGVIPVEEVAPGDPDGLAAFMDRKEKRK